MGGGGEEEVWGAEERKGGERREEKEMRAPLASIPGWPLRLTTVAHVRPTEGHAHSTLRFTQQSVQNARCTDTYTYSVNQKWRQLTVNEAGKLLIRSSHGDGKRCTNLTASRTCMFCNLYWLLSVS